ncbi:hypothetical protein K450DRAFT_217823 [Umbelopsis ramanniana AG]|uniref:Uncharacterized protein n=1 Tax=Umbelopsis ramanniana AG TaxID=1314678 RepID=A0AAD5HJH0_UMBRA|nr:uncharacterized protein K450DRAFT_217823 [Umbelopsis ramanniana AG]KAI8584746.1 hypothetical protein K450DRAFT_217823 [Umbelopsis ramanniana AG]
MKIVDLCDSRTSDSLAAMTDRKRQASPSLDTDLNLPDLDAELTRRIAQQREKLSKLNYVLQQLSEDITDQTSCTASTDKPIETILDHSQVPRSQPMDIQYPIAHWRPREHRKALEILPSYTDATISSPVASEPQHLQGADLVNQDRPIGTSTEHSSTTVAHEGPEDSIDRDIQQLVGFLSSKKSKAKPQAQRVIEASPAVIQQFRAFNDLFTYANARTEFDGLKRPQIQNNLMTLQILTEALCEGHVFQSDATSLIASSLSCLIESITVEAEEGPTEHCRSTLVLVDDLNETLQKWYSWDPEKDQFSSPFDVKDLSDVLTFFTLVVSSDLKANYVKQNEVVKEEIWETMGLKSKYTMNFHEILLATFNLRRLERGHSQPQPSQEEHDDILLEDRLEQSSVQRTDKGTTYRPQDDPVDFLWSDPEDDENEDNDQYDETDGSETTSVDGIFDSATEISGADVTENDWSEIDRESD